MAQLVEQLLPSEAHGSNPVIIKIYINICQLYEKTSVKKKRPGTAHLKKEVNKWYNGRSHLFLSVSVVGKNENKWKRPGITPT